jgi:predicted Zn-dependent protease
VCDFQQNSDAKFPITVRVIDRPAINAFTLPGGYIYLDSGTILAASNEAQLAGVLAHEIGHVAERSWASETTKRELLSYAMLPLMFTPMSIGTYYLVNGVMSSGIPIAFLKFSRNQEEGADFLAIQYLWKTGYDPNAIVAMFGKVLNEERQSPGSVAQIFMDHPPTPDRIIKIEEEIKLLPKRSQYLLNTSEFINVQQRLRTELRAPRHPWQHRPTLERRPTPGNPPPPGTQNSGKGSDSGDQPPVLGRSG